MPTRTKTRVHQDPQKKADRLLKLEKIAFGNIANFATFRENGEIDIDFDKAREAGAVVSVVRRKVGRGKQAQTVETTSIAMPNKIGALIKLGRLLGLFKPTGRRRNTKSR